MSIESREDLRGLKEAGQGVNLVLSEMKRHIRIGVPTAQLD